MGRVLKAASGIASRCGLNVPSRVIAAAAMATATAWLGAMLWGWAAENVASPGPCMLAALVSFGSVVVSLFTMAIHMANPSTKWTLEMMTGYAPFVMWRAMTLNGRVTAWKLILWPLLVPAEALMCLWLAVGWLARLLDVDLSKR